MKKQLLILGTVAVFALAGCGKSSDSGSKNSSAAPDGEKIVQQTCAGCHGGNLEGASGPALDKVGGKLSKDQILEVLKNGQNGGKMPAGLVSDEDAEAVAKYLSEKK
ncbi:MAG: c-type cytochrome [Bacillaceae bacterium]